MNFLFSNFEFIVIGLDMQRVVYQAILLRLILVGKWNG